MKIISIFLISVLIFTIIISLNFFEKSEETNYEWELTFEDNFDSFDSNKWLTHLANGRRTIWTNQELQWYNDSNVKVENGVLNLIAKKERIHGKDRDGEADFNYTSGMICGANTFVQAYGKWEMKVKFPFRKGFWPAFWIIPTQIPPLPEIDIFEYFGVDKNSISCAHHWGLDYPSPSNDFFGEPCYYLTEKKIKGDFADKWMIWTFECFPNKMVWKLDNNIVFEDNGGIPSSPLYILANVAVKDRAENNFEVGNEETPYIMEIDYIRVYQIKFKK